MAPTASSQPDQFAGVEIVQRLGESLPLDARFVDSTGAPVTLGGLLDDKPAVLALVYYECPMLCGMILHGMTTTLRTVDLQPGEDYNIIVVSFDPGETPEMAAVAKQRSIDLYKEGASPEAWHFLTGDAIETRRLAEAVGFSYTYDEATDEWAHSSAIMVITPQGLASSYYYGVQYSSRDVRLGLVEAANNSIGSPVDQLLLLCLTYDPTVGKYSATVLGVLRIAAVLTIIALVILFIVLTRSGGNSNKNSNRPSPVGVA
ncbi:MAG: SCO family protein [Acidobacteriota bacterium]